VSARPPRTGRRTAARALARAAALALAALAAAPSVPASAREGDDGGTRTALEELLVSREQRLSVDRGLAWLAEAQHKGGMWGDQRGTRIADTSLAVLALMAGGSTVGACSPLRDGEGIGQETLRGPYARNVREGLRFLARLAWSDETGKVPGYIAAEHDTSRMHGHGFATLALAEASGNLGPLDLKSLRAAVAGGHDPASMRLADQVRWGLERAVRCIERAQDHDTGGWTYEPDAIDHEGSMTVTQIAALRAAQDAGVRIDGAVMRRAYDYIKKSQNKTNAQYVGGFAYRMTMLDRVSYGLTAASLSTLFGLGRYGEDREDRAAIDLGLRYMDRNVSRVLDPDTQWFYYNLFYGAQALYLSGDERRIERDWPRIREAVLDQQRSDGSFRDCGPAADPGDVEYSTAIACLTLLVPMETLPIFQRR